MKRKTKKEAETICWKCKNACNSGCEWSRAFKPVPGWDVEAVEFIDNYKLVTSFRVISCPKFIKG